VIGLFFDPEVTDDVFHRNVCWFLTTYTVLNPSW
jgi:hypothetical protein